MAALSDCVVSEAKDTAHFVEDEVVAVDLFDFSELEIFDHKIIRQFESVL